MRINIYGNILGTSGYDNHIRGFSNALYKLNKEISILQNNIRQDWVRYVNDEEFRMISRPEYKQAVSILFTTPQFWRLLMQDKTNKYIGYLVWEGDKIPKYWLNYLKDKRIKQIWVPSRHVYNAIKNTVEEYEDTNYIINKIKIIPHGYNPKIFNVINAKPNKEFTFFCNKGWTGNPNDRGGVQYLIKAFTEEFSKDEKVLLKIKLNPAYPININQAMAGLNLPEDRPKIMLTNDDMPLEEINKLYNEADVYICSQRADAFNLPGLEAMGTATPTIQTGFGGQTDYMNDKNSWFIKYKLTNTGYIDYEETRWAEPDISHLRALMRQVYENRDEIKNKGIEAYKTARAYTWEVSASKALRYLKEI